MTRDFTVDVKKLLLDYPGIAQTTRNAQSEMDRLHKVILSEIARKEWFSATEFGVSTDWRLIQVTKKPWIGAVTPGCPWIHMEFRLFWDNSILETSLDIEPHPAVSFANCLGVAAELAKVLGDAKPDWLNKGGWIMTPNLPESRIFLLATRPVDPVTFTAEWIAQEGVASIDSLANVIPMVDQVISRLFPTRQPSGSVLEIVEANYGVTGRKVDVTSRIASLVSKTGTLSVRASNALGGDPAPGVKKSLTVRYRFKGKEDEATVGEGAVLALPKG